MPDLPLSGVRVLEIGGGVAAGFASHWLAGFGADVALTPRPAGALTDDETVYLDVWKRQVDDLDPGRLRELALASDIIVEDRKPGYLASRGLDPRALREAKPELVVVSITPFGQNGPYAGFETTNITNFAMGGIMSLTGASNRHPLPTGGNQAYQLGGLNGFSAAITTYYGALVHGEGDWVDISLQECAAGMLELYGPRVEYEQVEAHMRSGNHVSATWGIYPVTDGYAGVCCLARQVRALFSVVGDPELQEERFMDPLQRLQNDDELQARMYAWFVGHSKQEILELGPKHRIPFGAVLTPADLLVSQHLRDRGYFDRITTASGETAEAPGRPFHGFGWRGDGEVHRPGADTAAVLNDWLGVRA
ncbi:MAG: CoA transferase [Hyphomicrobiales bacterium]